MADVDEAEARDLYRDFRSQTLPSAKWTHEAHLAVCWCVMQEMEIDDAVDHLRRAIRSYNESTGTANTATSGYHETLTRYYVEAIARLCDEPPAATLGDPTCTRQAPLTFWSRDLLFSCEARADWVEPDLLPLPWRTPPSTTAA